VKIERQFSIFYLLSSILNILPPASWIGNRGKKIEDRRVMTSDLPSSISFLRKLSTFIMNQDRRKKFRD